MEALLARDLDLFEESFLKRLKSDLNGTERYPQCVTRVARREEPVAVVLLEVGLLPVAFEDRADLIDDREVSCRRGPDIPFQTGHLRGVSKVGRSDVRG